MRELRWRGEGRPASGDRSRRKVRAERDRETGRGTEREKGNLAHVHRGLQLRMDPAGISRAAQCSSWILTVWTYMRRANRSKTEERETWKGEQSG